MKSGKNFLAVVLTGFALGAEALAPLVGLGTANVVPNSYIVVMKDDVSNSAFESHLAWADGILRAESTIRRDTYSFGNFRAYSIKAPLAVASLLADNDQISYIEADQIFHLAAESVAEPLEPREIITQTNAPWNLARISQRRVTSNTYYYDRSAGERSFAYILDTGVSTGNPQFEGRASFGYNAAGGSNDDTVGSGTYLAGIVGSRTYGVAKKVRIIAVKIFSGSSGSNKLDTDGNAVSTVINAINWSVNDVTSKGRQNLSSGLLAIGGGYSAALNNAVKQAANSGLFFAVAAGSENSNAANYSPASEPSACTAAGIDTSNAKSTYSNFGSAIDIFAPAQNIISLAPGNGTGTNTRSGTDAAAAHVAGVGAYFLTLQPRAPEALCAFIRQVATRDAVTNVPSGTNNLLLYNDSGF